MFFCIDDDGDGDADNGHNVLYIHICFGFIVSFLFVMAMNLFL